MRKSLLKTIAATAAIGATILIANVTVWADSSFSMTDYTKWYNGETQLTSKTIGKSNDTYHTENGGYTLYYISGENAGSDAIGDKGNNVDNGFKMGGKGISWTQRYFWINDVPNGATVTVSAEGNYEDGAAANKKNQDYLTYQWGNGSKETTDTTVLTNRETPTDFAITNNTGNAAKFQFTFANKKQVITSVTITLPENPLYTTEYDIASALLKTNAVYQGGSSTEPSTGRIAATTATTTANVPALLVDATSGKVGYNNSDWAQFTKGAKLTVPNVPAGSTVTLNLFSGTEATINGDDYTAAYSVTSTGDVEIISTTAGGYIKSILISGPAFDFSLTDNVYVGTNGIVVVKDGAVYAIGKITGSIDSLPDAVTLTVGKVAYENQGTVYNSVKVSDTSIVSDYEADNTYFLGVKVNGISNNTDAAALADSVSLS